MPLSVPNNSGDNLTTVFRHIEEYLYAIAQAGGGGGGSLPDQTGESGNFLTTNGTTASWAPVQTAPALPVWTYTAGAVGSGQFSADQGDPPSTTVLIFSNETKYGPTSFASFFGSHVFTGTTIYMTDSSGVCSVLQTTGSMSGSNLPVEILASSVGSEWSGDYQVFFVPPTNIPEALNASSITPFTGNVNPITAIEVTTGIVTSAS
jgi:hypothetical protein